MLKRIIFIIGISYSDYLGMILEDVKKACKNLEIYGLKTAIYNPHAMEQDDWESECEFKKETLYITDRPEVLSELLNEHFYVIALFHDYNKGKDFSKAIYAVEDVKEIEYDSFRKAYERLARLPWHIIDTERLIIRETTVEDVDIFYKIYQEPSITYYMEELYEDIEEEKEYVRNYIDKMYSFFGYGIWTVLLKDTSEVIGRVGFSLREGYEVPELGFVIASEHQRKGYALEACKAIINYARAELGFDEIQALVEVKNEASVKLCNKLGFEYKRDVLLKEKMYRFFMKKL